MDLNYNRSGTDYILFGLTSKSKQAIEKTTNKLAGIEVGSLFLD